MRFKKIPNVALELAGALAPGVPIAVPRRKALREKNPRGRGRRLAGQEASIFLCPAPHRRRERGFERKGLRVNFFHELALGG